MYYIKSFMYAFITVADEADDEDDEDDEDEAICNHDDRGLGLGLVFYIFFLQNQCEETSRFRFFRIGFASCRRPTDLNFAIFRFFHHFLWPKGAIFTW